MVALGLLPPPKKSLSRQHGAVQQYWPPIATGAVFSNRAPFVLGSSKFSGKWQVYGKIQRNYCSSRRPRRANLDSPHDAFSTLQPWWFANSKKELTNPILLIAMEFDAMKLVAAAKKQAPQAIVRSWPGGV